MTSNKGLVRSQAAVLSNGCNNGSIRVVRALNKTAVQLCRLFLFLFLLLAVLPARSLAADGEETFELDAEKLTYSDLSGIATADGNVEARGNNIQLFAPAAVYDTHSGMITAHSEGDEKITMITGGMKLTGQSVEYNVQTQRGRLTQPDGKMDAIYFSGGDMTVMPVLEAVEENLIRRPKRSVTSDDVVVFWPNAVSTTCEFPEPHYKLVSKHVIIFPNRRVVLKRPQIHVEKKMIFQYPFDYVVRLDKKEDAFPLMPRVTYDSDMGVGLGISGPFVWEGGQLEVSAVYWTGGEWEAELAVNQQIGRDFTLFANSNRLYNKDERETLWRPSWGIIYENQTGWTAKLYESQRELVETEMRPGMDVRYNVWRSPEFVFGSPWFKFAPKHFFRFGGAWGQYQDNMERTDMKVDRWTGGAEIYGETSIGIKSVHPFYRVSYRHFDYDGGDDTQDVTDVTAGFHWDASKTTTLSTAYLRRWVDGRSPLHWDRYYDRKDLYQQIAFRFPGTREWETWKVSVRAAYDFIDNELSEMVYSVSYNKHCLTWELYAKDSRPNNELSVGIRFIINAYPEQKLALGEPSIFNPFRRPVPASVWNK